MAVGSGSTPLGASLCRSESPASAEVWTARRSASLTVIKSLGRCPGQAQEKVDPAAQLRERQVLGPVIRHPKGEPFQTRVGVALVRKNHDFETDRLGRSAQLLQNLQPIQNRHPDIKQ